MALEETQRMDITMNGLYDDPTIYIYMYVVHKVLEWIISFKFSDSHIEFFVVFVAIT